MLLMGIWNLRILFLWVRAVLCNSFNFDAGCKNIAIIQSYIYPTSFIQIFFFHLTDEVTEYICINIL